MYHLKMNSLVKTEKEINILREGGKLLADIRDEIANYVKSGITTADLNDLAEKLIKEVGGKAAFLNYTPSGAERPYPAALCVSVNEEIVHGISNEKPRTLKEGDIVGLDIGLTYKGMITDTAVTVAVGEIDEKTKDLMNVTKEALRVGIEAARGGAHVGDIGYAIEQFVNGRYGIVQELGGHGVGRQVHEDPMIPNYGSKGTGMELVPGMVVALEPMLNEGTEDIVLSDDGYTFETADGKKSAHFEHTILITEGEAEIITGV